jgi:hypothetical protein
MADDLKKEDDDYETDPHKVSVSRIGNFEIFADTTDESGDVYFAVSMLNGKVAAKGTDKADIIRSVDKLNQQIAEEKAKKNENCPFCANKDSCKDKGDPSKVDCYVPPTNNVFDMMG